MSATAIPAQSDRPDRSDLRTVMLGGTKLGLVTGVAVVAFLAASRQVTGAVPRSILEALIVLAAGSAVSLLPAQWTAARGGGSRHCRPRARSGPRGCSAGRRP